MEHRPARLGKEHERTTDHGLLGAIDQPGIVHESDPASDVVESVAGKGAPGSDSERKACGRPHVYAHGAVSQVVHCTGHVGCVVVASVAVYEQRHVERAPKALVAELDRLAQVSGGIVAGKLHGCHHPAERLLEEDRMFVRGTDVHHGGGETIGRVPEGADVAARIDDAAVPLVRPRVIGRAVGP